MVDMTIDERLDTVRFRVDATAHITLDPKLCGECEKKSCLHICPANLFVLLSDGQVMFNHEHCLECGACAFACNQPGALHWSYPRGGFGVTYREA